ncbi:carboxylesterase/lipase family protein [Sphingobium sp. CR2-8]|uniref:carboxylesterase/lipase family protein n=1 Tax=Sphingobium sp. CR2-8 TaxID=1306534 RepID=UPI002DB8E097|nr:carboxylesterase/lipase family protein [Sphingobium sp. CR2-8]MEC3909344.1 carboxylesterase/lipase family protein [Sphingobium sp. CR2-8]
MTDMDRRVLLAGLAAAALPTQVYAKGRASPVASTRFGKVRGTIEKDVLVFRGVRYGADTAPRRFRRALPPQPWTGIADATRYGAAAPQTKADEPTSEDCLFLNVWTPALDAGKRPVMVYLHGGAHAHGSGSDPLYDGGNLVRRGDVVVVTLNHRLAGLGYAYLAGLGGPAESGNVGNLDIVLALRWVRDNIAGFGGDPNRVMLFGQSGGGAKVVTLMAMPEARPLFHAAATMSGQHVTAAGPMHATTRARAWMAKAGAPDLATLMTLPVERLVEAMTMVDPLENKGEISFTSTLDHGVLPRHPFVPDAPREAAHIPLIVGNTRDETALWIEKMLRAGDTTWDNLPERYARETTKDMAPDHVIARYRALYPDRTPGQILLAATTAGRSWPGHLIQAEERAKIGAPTWMYQLDFPCPEAGGLLGAFHTLDIPLVFDNVDARGSRTGVSADARRLAGQMADAFIALGRTGDPNGGGRPAWPHYDLTRRSTMIFDRRLRIEDDPRREERLLFAVAPYIKPGG